MLGSLGIFQTIVGVLIDGRSVVLFRDPTPDEERRQNESRLRNLLGGGAVSDAAQSAVDAVRNEISRPVELFQGFGIPVLTGLTGVAPWGVSYMDADIDPQSELTDHPLENNRTLTDSAILQPLEATIRVAMPTLFWTRIYREMEDYFMKKKPMKLQTKLAVYRNMVLAAMPHKIGYETVDRPIIELQLRQVIEVVPHRISNAATVPNPAPRAAADAPTTQRGSVEPQPLSIVGNSGLPTRALSIV